jgi:thiosulfate/3-mercaptopyruvate sulfurtransferase
MNIPIHPDELQGLIDETCRPIILDARPTEVYAAGHIASAFNVDSFRLAPEASTFEGMIAFHSDVDAAFRLLGRFEKVEFVVYGDAVDAVPCRALWLMQYSGQLGARLLLGGLERWRQEGHSVTTELPEIDRTPFPVRSRRELMARLDEVTEAVQDEKTLIVDTRSLGEFSGDDVPEGSSHGGSIPGAIHFPVESLVTEDQRMFVDEDRLRPRLEACGITPDRTIIPYSNAAGRSSIFYVALKILGYRRVKNFLGGWTEWSQTVPS